MYKDFKIVFLDSNYTEYLSKFDDKVSYNSENKKDRPFIGVLFKIKDFLFN